MFRFVLKVLFLFGVFVGMTKAQDIDNQLYNTLLQVMTQREVLWFTPPPNGTRDSEISGIVCPFITEKSLDEMYNDLKQLDTVEYKYFEVDGSVYVAGTRRWLIKRPLDRGGVSVLAIIIGPDAKCTAQYQHLH